MSALHTSFLKTRKVFLCKIFTLSPPVAKMTEVKLTGSKLITQLVLWSVYCIIYCMCYHTWSVPNVSVLVLLSVQALWWITSPPGRRSTSTTGAKTCWMWSDLRRLRANMEREVNCQNRRQRHSLQFPRKSDKMMSASSWRRGTFWATICFDYFRHDYHNIDFSFFSLMFYFLVSDTRKHWFDSCWRKTSFEFPIIPFLSVQWSLIHGRIFLWAVLFHSCQEPSQWCICHRAASFVENKQFAAGASFIKTFFDLYLNSVLRSFHYVPFIKALKKNLS